MVIIYASATAPIHLASSTPAAAPSQAKTTLTRSECWAALERICRDPVPHTDRIRACRVVHEEKDRDGHLKGLTRMIRGQGSRDGEVEEVAVLKRPVMIEFEFPKTGSFITSILAPGAGGADKGGAGSKAKELYLTQMYEWNCPEIKEGSQDHWDRQAEYFQLAMDIVGHTAEEVRKMKKDGILEGDK